MGLVAGGYAFHFVNDIAVLVQCEGTGALQRRVGGEGSHFDGFCAIFPGHLAVVQQRHGLVRWKGVRVLEVDVLRVDGRPGKIGFFAVFDREGGLAPLHHVEADRLQILDVRDARPILFAAGPRLAVRQDVGILQADDQQVAGDVRAVAAVNVGVGDVGAAVKGNDVARGRARVLIFVLGIAAVEHAVHLAA